jgi:hypothetical protein
VTVPDPYGSGQEAIQPPPGQGYYPPPPGQAVPPRFTGVPAVPAGYGYGQYPAVAVPPGMHVDQASGLLLPNGTELASVGRRIGAGFLTIPLAIATLGIGYIIWGLIVWGNGQTPALQVLGMRAMALREIPGRIINHVFGLVTLLTSFVLFAAGREHKALHDWIAGTVVLHDPDNVLGG